MTLLLISIFAALSISALCSLMEAALLSLPPSQIAAIADRWPRIGVIWKRFKSDIERPIAAILVLNTAAHTIGASVAGAEFDRLFGGEWIAVFSLGFTYLMLQFTEILPKGAGVRYNRQIAVWMARPLALLIRAMRPVVLLVRAVNRLFGWRQSYAEPAATIEEIAALAGLARLSKEISTDQERIITRGTRLSDVHVREIMRPRVEIDALDVNTPPGEVVGAVAMSGFARVPVYEGDLDHVMGFIYNKDLLRHLHMGWPADLRKILHPALMVPETLPLDQLLELFREKRTQMAIVLDEYGGTEGLATIEDVLEQIVGAIHDEHRSAHPGIVRRDETSWLVGGTTRLRDLAEAVDDPELGSAGPQQVSTIGGLIQSALDRVPVGGDRIEWGRFSIEVVKMEGLRVGQVLVSRKASPSQNR
ncbi:MAG: HlyC/CorC family transporter [Pirellulales bacterium]|nr:HlyC/CorC family transporter [Pirellulales bacterium]